MRGEPPMNQIIRWRLRSLWIWGADIELETLESIRTLAWNDALYGNLRRRMEALGKIQRAPETLEYTGQSEWIALLCNRWEQVQGWYIRNWMIGQGRYDAEGPMP